MVFNLIFFFSQTHDLADARIAEVHCNKSTYLTLLQCSYKDINSGSDFFLCTDQDDVTVTCCEFFFAY